jgi:ribosomal protein L22
MSPEDEKDLPGETPAEPPAAKKRGIGKRIAKRGSAKKDSAEQEAAPSEPAPSDPALREPSATEAAAPEPAAKAASEPVAKGPAAKAAKDPAAKATKEPAASKPVAKEPDAKEPAGSKRAAAKRRGGAEAPDQPVGKPARVAGQGAKQTTRRRVVRARARYVRTSARKARMVCGHLRGKSVQEARAILAFTPREVARDWSKLLESAVANAESNHELLEDDLIVREAYADEGPTIKRFRPRAMGRATPIRKRTSHLTITLTPGP